MQRSTERVLTTFTGSLPRPDDLAALLIARQEGREVDQAAFDERVRGATAEAVARQVELGIDVVSDGELSKPGYTDYLRDRLTGFGGVSDDRAGFFADLASVPELLESSYKGTRLRFPFCQGDVEYCGQAAVARDIADFQRALAQTPAIEAFIPAASPGIIAMRFPNKHYPRYEDYLFALADALREEYAAIASAGLLVQIDAPDLGFCNDFHTWMRDEVERRGVRGLQDLHVEAINRSLEGISPESVRMHLCWGNYMGPHVHDQPLRDVLEPALRANVTGLTFEAANPAHAHEWELFEELALPDDKVIVPGVVDTKTQVVEHPRLVAQRIRQFVDLVGRERVIAGTDCGFGTFVGAGMVHPKIAWHKLRVLGEGARMAE